MIRKWVRSKQWVSAALLLTGLLSFAAASIVTPDFARAYLSPDHQITESGLDHLRQLRASAVTIGAVFVAGAAAVRFVPATLVRRAARWARQPAVIIGGITLLGTALRFYHLSFESLWHDEAMIYVIAQGPVAEVVRKNALLNSAPPLYALGVERR
jgi:hypothetical protein